MSKILKVRTANDYVRYLGGQEHHPLVGIVDYAALSPIRHSLNNYGVYECSCTNTCLLTLSMVAGNMTIKVGALSSALHRDR